MKEGPEPTRRRLNAIAEPNDDAIPVDEEGVSGVHSLMLRV
jgi:hypothetical protein